MTGTTHEGQYTLHFLSFLAQLSLEWEIFQKTL